MPIVGGFPGSQKWFVFWGSFFKMDFRRRPFNQKPLVFRKKSKDPSGSPRIIWWWRDFPRMSKIMIFKETRAYFDAQYLSAPFCHAKTAWIAIWGQIIFLFEKIKFFSFAASGGPYCLGGTKRRNSNSNSLFLVSKTGIWIDTKWHHMAPNWLLIRRISIIFRRTSFWIFQKIGFWGNKRRIGDELQVLKFRKSILVVFLTFLSAK